jgi:hypothetical protein
MENILKFGSEFLTDLRRRQEQDIISKKIIEAELLTTQKLTEFQSKAENLETFADDFKKIQTEINTKIISNIKDSFIKNKIFNYLDTNKEKLYRENLLKSQSGKLDLLNQSINDQLIDLQKLAKYGTKNLDEIIKMANYSLSGIRDLVPAYQLKNIQEKAIEKIVKNHFESLLTKNTVEAEQFLTTDWAKKYLQHGYLAEVQLKQHEKLNKLKSDVIKETRFKGLKDRIRLGYDVQPQEIDGLAPYIGLKEVEILQEENNFMQVIRKLNKDELEKLKNTVDKNRIPQIDSWISSLNTQLRNNPLKTADKLGIISLQDIDFNDENTIRKREEDVKVIQSHYQLYIVESLLPEEKRKINEFLDNSTSSDALEFGRLLYRNGETILSNISESFLQTIKYSKAGYIGAEANALKILEGEKIRKTLEKKPFKELGVTLDLVIGDAFSLNREFMLPLKERISDYLISELKTTHGGLFFGNKSFEIEEATESDVRKAIKSVTGSEIGELNGSFYLTPPGYTESNVKKYIKRLNVEAYWNNRKIYPQEILKYGNLKMVDENQYLVYMRGNNKNSDYLRDKDGGYFVLSFD